jgi:hypothetical protein
MNPVSKLKRFLINRKQTKLGIDTRRVAGKVIRPVFHGITHGEIRNDKKHHQRESIQR